MKNYREKLRGDKPPPIVLCSPSGQHEEQYQVYKQRKAHEKEFYN